MVKCRPSDRNKKLSAIKDGFRGKGPYASELNKSFQPTSFLCNSIGKPIWYEGKYDYGRHLKAYNRAKMWMPTIVDGKILWRQNPKMKPLQRLFGAQPDLDIIDSEGRPPLSGGHRNLWCGDLPPIQIGMIGEYNGEKAIVVDRGFKKSKRRKCVGIGDKGNIFKSIDEASVDMLGVYFEEVDKPSWIVQTKVGRHEICKNSRSFKRKNLIIKGFNPDIHLKKYLK
jgi:hypothetical protein